MALTTLITFMLQAPTTVLSVDILGSWDNFSKPYQLKRDRKTGPDQWRGCHTFTNITCDGDTLTTSTSRDGCLKMGGTYWYYYVLDGDIEYHDPAEPSTTLCPLLPGQVVNVLEVPVQGNMLFGGVRNASSSSLDSAVFTMDPHARKARLPAIVKPVVRARCNGLIEKRIVPQTSKTTQDALTLERQRSPLSIFHRMRQTRSAGSDAKSNLVWPRNIFSRAGQPKRQEAPNSVLEIAKLHDHMLSPSPTTTGHGSQLPIQLPSAAAAAADSADRAPTAVIVNMAETRNNVHPLEQYSPSKYGQSIPLDEGKQGVEDRHTTSPLPRSRSSSSSYHTPVEQLTDTFSYSAQNAADESNDVGLSDHRGQLNLAPNTAEPLTEASETVLQEQIAIPIPIPSTESSASLELDFHSPRYGYAESLASYAASANFSPCFASKSTQSGLMSPCHLSQAETPVTSEFGDDLLPALRNSESSDCDLSVRPSSSTGPPNLSLPQGGDMRDHDATLGGFQGYGLPDHASILTVQELPSLAFKNADGASPFTQPKSKHDLVHSWNDGSERHMTALGELVDDLGYLGQIII